MNQNPTAIQYRRIEDEQQDNHEAGLVVSLSGALRRLEAGFDGAGDEGVVEWRTTASRSQYSAEQSASRPVRVLGWALNGERSISPNSSQYFQKEICILLKKKEGICIHLNKIFPLKKDLCSSIYTRQAGEQEGPRPI